MIESKAIGGGSSRLSLVFSLPAEGVEVFAAEIGESASDLNTLGVVLSSAERERAARFKFERDRDRYVWRQALLRFALAEHLGCEPAEIEYAVSEQGKPRLSRQFLETLVSLRSTSRHPGDDQRHAPIGVSCLPSPVSPLRFNLSHSDGLMALVLAESAEVGVDVERIRPMSDLEVLAQRCLTGGELGLWRDLDQVDRNAVFFWIWTRKEAVLKAMGTGLSVEPQSVEVWGQLSGPEDRGSRIGELRAGATKAVDFSWEGEKGVAQIAKVRGSRLVTEAAVLDPSGREWRLWSFQPREGWWGAVAAAVSPL